MIDKKCSDSQNHISVYRNELKYYISYLDYIKMRGILSKFLKTDDNTCSEGGYWIRSLYFDTPDDKEYIEKVIGIDKRKKIRLRLYNVQDKKIKLEIKHKHYDYMHKETTSLTRDQASRLINGDKSFLLNTNNRVMNQVYYYMCEKYYIPVVIVDYYRYAFIGDFNNIRITFDRDITACSTNFDIFQREKHSTPAISNESIVMEVKYNIFLPDWLKMILSSIEAMSTAISKYCYSRECLYNENSDFENMVL